MKNSIFSMFQGTSPQVVAALISSIGAISDGMQYGWTAPIASVFQSPSSPVQISKTEMEWLESLYLLGGIAGLPVTIYLVDKIGRHKSILTSAVPSLIAWLLIGVATSVEYLYIARFCAGFAGDMAFVAAPMYVAEIADRKIRGFLASTIYLMMLAGILIIYTIVPFVPYYVPSLVGTLLLLFQLVFFPFMPESPYYLIGKNKLETAKSSLDQLRISKDNASELHDIQDALARQKKERGRPQDLFLVNSNRKALLIITVLNGAQHFAGISVILMNLHSILERAGSIYIEPSSAGIVFSGIMLISGTISSFIVDKYGRKILLITSSLFTGLCLSVLGAYYSLKMSGYNLDTISWIPVVSVMIYAAFFKFGLGIVPIVLTAELFPAKVKAMGMTISDAIYVLFSLLSIALYQWLDNIYGIHVPIVIFAGCTFIITLYCVFCIPETKGRTLEQIQLLLKEQV